MNPFPVDNLQPGKYFTAQAFLDEKYILLSPETPLTQELIERLQRWEFSQISSEGDLVDTPTAGVNSGADTVTIAIDQDIKETALLKEARSLYSELLDFTEHLFTAFVTKNELPQRDISEQVKHVIDMVRSHRRYVLRLNELQTDAHNYIVDHSVKTAILSVAVGATVKLPPHKLIDLGTAALLHELGMIRLPPQLYMSQKVLAPQEKKAITAHTLLGFKILKQYSFPMPVCLAVLECRENMDGSGYPRGLTGEKISLYAKIIMVAGSFSALVSRRPYRDPVDGHSALLDMAKHSGRVYDEVVLRALIANLSIYPLGTHVQLASGERAVVVDTGATPKAPKVRIVAGSEGAAYAEQPIVTTDDGADHAIVRSLPPVLTEQTS